MYTNQSKELGLVQSFSPCRCKEIRSSFFFFNFLGRKERSLTVKRKVKSKRIRNESCFNGILFKFWNIRRLGPTFRPMDEKIKILHSCFTFAVKRGFVVVGRERLKSVSNLRHSANELIFRGTQHIFSICHITHLPAGGSPKVYELLVTVEVFGNLLYQKRQSKHIDKSHITHHYINISRCMDHSVAGQSALIIISTYLL